MVNKDEVIVVHGNKVVRLSKQEFDDVIGAAEQMRDDWFEHAKNAGLTKKRAEAGYSALCKLSSI